MIDKRIIESYCSYIKRCGDINKSAKFKYIYFNINDYGNNKQGISLRINGVSYRAISEVSKGTNDDIVREIYQLALNNYIEKNFHIINIFKVLREFDVITIWFSVIRIGI